MTIYKTPYDTSSAMGYRYGNIIQEVRHALVGGGLAIYGAVDSQYSHPAHGGADGSARFQIALLEGGNAFADSVHFFRHPVFVRNDNQDYLAIDVRDFGKWNEPQRRFEVRNVPEFVWNIKRGLLTCIWNDGRQNALRDISNLPAQVYCALVSESIARRFVLDMAEQAAIAVLAGYFYYGLFTDTAPDADEKNNLAGKIARITFVDANRVFQLIDPLGAVPDLNALCEAIKASISNVALANLNVGTLLSVIGNNWYGHNAREVLCMALEHVPTWLMVVSASLSSQTFKRSTLAKLSARFDKRGAGDQFTQALAALLGGPEGVQNLPTYSDSFGSA